MLVFKTKKRAIEIDKEMIKETTGLKRLTRLSFNYTDVNCTCGETMAIEISQTHNSNIKATQKHIGAIVAICKICGAK